MKKALSLILALVLCLPLCACGGGSGGNTETTASVEKPEESVTTIQIGEKVQIGEYAIKIQKITYEEKATIRGIPFVPGDDQTFCVVEFILYNESRKTLELYSTPNLSLNYDNGYDVQYFKTEWSYGTSTSIVQEVSAGKSISYKYYADVPDVQVDDKTSSKVLIIKYLDQEFQLILQ